MEPWIVLHAVSDALGQVPVNALKQPRSRFLVQTMVQVKVDASRISWFRRSASSNVVISRHVLQLRVFCFSILFHATWTYHQHLEMLQHQGHGMYRWMLPLSWTVPETPCATWHRKGTGMINHFGGDYGKEWPYLVHLHLDTIYDIDLKHRRQFHLLLTFLGQHLLAAQYNRDTWLQVVVALPSAVPFQITTYVKIGNPCFRSLSKWTNAKNGNRFNFVAYSGLIQNSAKAAKKGLSGYPVIHLSVAMPEAIPSLCLTNNKESKAFVCLTNSTILADT